MRHAPKIVTWLMLAVLAWVVVAALRHKATANSESPPPASTTSYADPLRSYREPYRVYREISQSAGIDPKDHANHPKTSSKPVASIGELANLERDGDGWIRLTWEALSSTPVGNDGRPTFPAALQHVLGERRRTIGHALCHGTSMSFSHWWRPA
jgi:hypothetical protein